MSELGRDDKQQALIARACDYLQDMESPFTDAEANELCAVLRSSLPSATERMYREEDVLQAIADEPELPGAMPDEMWAVMNSGDRDAVTEAMRIAVRQTKEGIRERLLAHEPKKASPEIVTETETPVQESWEGYHHDR